METKTIRIHEPHVVSTQAESVKTSKSSNSSSLKNDELVIYVFYSNITRRNNLIIGPSWSEFGLGLSRFM